MLAIPLGLANRDGLAGEQRLVGVQVGAGKDDGVGRDAVSLGQHHDVAASHVAAGDADPFAVTPDQGARAGQVAQSVQCVLGPLLLVVGDADDDEDESQQHQGFFAVAKDQVQCAAGEEQEEHRFLDDLEQDVDPSTFARRGQLVEPFVLEASLCLCGRQTLWLFCVGVLVMTETSMQIVWWVPDLDKD